MSEEQPTLTEQVFAEVLASVGNVLEDVSESMRTRVVRNILERMSQLAQGNAHTAELLESTIALDLVTARKISLIEARQLILRITKIAATVASLIPGFVGIAIGALSALIPEPQERNDD